MKNCLSQNCQKKKKADEWGIVIGRKACEIKSNRATGNDEPRKRVELACGQARTVLCLQLRSPMRRCMCRLSSVGCDDTPKETLGRLKDKHSWDTVFQRRRENKIKLGGGGGVKSKSEGRRIREECGLALQWHWHCVCYSCYIMDGMGECECCIRQGGLQGRADTEDTPEASPLMPDMLLRLQGFS